MHLPKRVRYAPLILAATLAATAYASAASAPWRDWQVIWRFHTDIALGYNAGTEAWILAIDRGGEPAFLYPAESTLLLATDETIRTVPAGVPPSFDFLGEEGDTYYLLPFSTPPSGSNILYLGSNGERIPSGTFLDNEVHWTLTDFAGPGDFILYRVVGGQPTIDMDSREAAPPYGPGFRERRGGHSHFNWIFRERGIYLLSFQLTGELIAGGTVSSDPVPFFFLVDPKPVEWWLVDRFREEVHSPHAELGADAFGDGYSNLLAYAFGYSPFESAIEFLPQHELVESENQTFLSLTFRQPGLIDDRADRSDLVYRVLASEDLVSWADITDTAVWEEVEADADETPRVRVRDVVPIDESSRRFLRLSIDHQP